AELSMDELSEITEYIQTEAGDEAEMIFGHGVDEQLGDRIRVTVIATGFVSETMKAYQKETRKVIELDRGQTWLFAPDNTINEGAKEMTVRTEPAATKPAAPKEPERQVEREITFSGPFLKVEETKKEQTPEPDEESLLAEEEQDELTARYEEQLLDEQRMMELTKTRERLEAEARERKAQLKDARRHEMTKEEFNEKWSLPAYLRRGVKMQSVPHSSESYISKYNLNDDNTILGNNKFLHDNVD